LLSNDEIIDWFFDHDIIPGQTNIIAHPDYVSLMFDAIDQGESFRAFVKEVVVSSGHHEYVVNVDSWQELYTAYSFFLTGYTGNKA
jgi:hypothetical protein